jgi:transposase
MDPRHDETQMSQSSWLVAGIVPGVERQPLKKLAIDEHALLKLLNRWRGEAEKKGHRITRIAVAFEAGHDGFWLARWLAAQGLEAHVIHASSVAVTREHRRAKTDRLDTELLKRGFLGWLRAGSARPWLARRAGLSLGLRRRSSGSAFAALTRGSRRPPIASRPYARPRVSRSRRIRWPRPSAIWSATRS